MFQTAGLFRAVLVVFWKPSPRFEIRIISSHADVPLGQERVTHPLEHLRGRLIRICSFSENSSTTRPNLFFKISWHLRTNIKSSWKVWITIFLDILWQLTQWGHAGKELKTLPIIHVLCAPAQRCLTSNPRQCLKSLEISKETFRGFWIIKSENLGKWIKFQTALYLLL